MAGVMDYSSLIENLKDLFQTKAPDNDNISRIFDIAIENAHLEIYREIRDIGEISEYIFGLEARNPLFYKPANWASTQNLYIYVKNDTIPLLPITYSALMYLDNTRTGVPKYYTNVPAQDGNKNNYSIAQVFPIPNIEYTAKLIYIQRPDVITKTNQTNWITKRVPDLLLAKCASLVSLALETGSANSTDVWNQKALAIRENVDKVNETQNINH